MPFDLGCMELSRTLRFFIYNLFVFIITSLLFSACSDETHHLDNEEAEGGVCFRIPIQNNFETRAISSDEQKINSLNIFLFHNDGKLYKNIDLSILVPENNDNYNEYTISDIRSGEYFIIAIANFSDYLSEASKTTINSFDLTKDELEKMLLEFNNKNLTAENLPRACLYPIINNDETSQAITIKAGSKISITLPLKFLCSKIRYTILFNSDEGGFSTDFKNKTFEISQTESSKYITNLIASTKIKPSGINDFQHSLLVQNEDTVRWPFSLTKYEYPEEFYSEDPNNKFPGQLTAEYNDNSSLHKMAWQGITYIPENLSEEFSVIYVEAEVGSNGNTIRHKSEVKRKVDNNFKGIARGEMFEIVTKVTSYSPIEWETSVSASNWNDVILPVDLVHSYLILAQTENISVSSGNPAIIAYNTDGLSEVTVESIQKINNKPIITGYSSQDEKGNDVLLIGLNSAITLDEFDHDKLQGENIECYVTAGNIRKMIKVSYIALPFLSLSQNSLKFNNESSTTQESQSFNIYSNLNDLKIYRCNENGEKDQEINLEDLFGAGVEYKADRQFSDKNGELKSTSSSLVLNAQKMNNSDLEIFVKLQKYGDQAIHHYLLVEGEYENIVYQQLVDIITSSPDLNHRIYFRAINDYVYGVSDEAENNFLNGDYSNYIDEDSQGNWNDWWDYISENTDSEFFTPKIRFNNNSEFISMIKDPHNPGWYFYEIDSDIVLDDFNFVFSASGLDKDEWHRCPHNDMESLPFIVTDDKEVWYLYDPTTEPYYSIWDEKPEIEDVTYTVYTDSPVAYWSKTNGGSAGSVNSYTIKYSFGEPSSDNNAAIGKCLKLEENKYVTQFKLKSLKAFHSKAITLNIQSVANIDDQSYVYLLLTELPVDYYDEVELLTPKIQLFFKDGSSTRSQEMELYGSKDDYPLYRQSITEDSSYINIILQFQLPKNPTIYEYTVKDIPLFEYNIIFNSKDLGKSPIPYEKYENSSSEDVLLFKGYAFPDDTGYYFNGVWNISEN